MINNTTEMFPNAYREKVLASLKKYEKKGKLKDNKTDIFTINVENSEMYIYKKKPCNLKEMG